ncbi:hypothetical protein BDN72DRAFT_906549 [Pluteus cervinus]|uniref:Uncharacterized protein n=1 Tax=Pluteus cervinus TaxID=181527 RepID=A0ACD2ZYJ0_9AGAR|nr:hypothetical protein BDN72DRAFT_906549 [Pluteus cervinus]
MPFLAEGKKLERTLYPDLFKKLLIAMLDILRGEQLRLQAGGEEEARQLVNELIAYTYNKEPFQSHPWTRETKPLKWWTQLSKDSNAKLIGRIAIKVFSISPSEICDERTASRLGWFNAARRSSITPEHLVDSAKLYDFYVNGFKDSASGHSARVHLPTVTQLPSISPITSVQVQSAPSLMDLLHTDNVEPMEVNIAVLEEQLFNSPDPYDLAETERVHEELQDLVIRSSVRFDIADYVKLQDPKLIALITNVDTAGPGVASLPRTQAAPVEPIGKPGQWDPSSFF